MGAIKREMNNGKWTAFAICYECGFAYLVALVCYQIGGLFTGEASILGVIVAVAVVAFGIYMLVRKDKYNDSQRLKAAVR